MHSIIKGFHVLAKGNLIEAQKIAKDIYKNQRLLVGSGTFFGSGVYAYFLDNVPKLVKHLPGVVFEISQESIEKIHVPIPDKPDFQFFKIPGNIGDFISIKVLGFRNLKTAEFLEYVGELA